VAAAGENTGKINSSAAFSIERKFYVSLAFTIPLLLHMVMPFPLLHDPLFQLLMATPVFLIGASHFGKSSWGSLKEGMLNMDVLIFIGSTAAYVYSVIGTFILKDNNYLFFETSASIITLVLLGNVIEKRSVKKTRSAVAALTSLQPQKAKLIEFFNEKAGEKLPAFGEVIHEIDYRDISVGQYFLVNSGDRVPADGTVAWGQGWVNESMITGESIPVEKKSGSPVIAGTIVSDGVIKMHATATGKETVLSRIIEMVNDAQRNKPKIQRLADRVTAFFVPLVLLISAATFFGSYFLFDLSFQQSIMSSIGVLVISCPCAMGLATPTAVMVGIGRAAGKGILIKGAQSLETLASVKTVVFDKTGTLTTGQFTINKISATSVSEKELRSILASLEKFSSHPIAKSIVSELKEEVVFELNDVVENKGMSVMGTDTAGNRYEAGSYKIAAPFTNDHSFNVYVLKNGQLAGMADVTDEIRPGIKEVIAYLKKAGIKTIMVSGDKTAACKKIASELGIDEYHSQKLPAEKLSIIRQLMQQSPVAMVGDGINDAPALAAATIGISLSSATQVAIDSAQVILLHGNPALLPEALKISRETLLTIKQNLFWAFFYNIIAIPIAAAGLLKPIVGAASMAFSDVIVIGNSLRLRSKKLS
jgi:Cu+-exporting ATPase